MVALIKDPVSQNECGVFYVHEKREGIMEKPWYKVWPAIYPKSLRYYEGSIVDFMEASARKFPDRKALIFMEKPMTYGELLDQTLRLATALTNLGLKTGERVA